MPINAKVQPSLARKLLIPLVLLLFLLTTSIIQAQQPVFRIGVLDDPLGSVSQGARLAVQRLNASGGVVGADGTAFRLELVTQATDDLQTAVANIQQASVIAVLGPADNGTVLNNLGLLQGLNVPILTTAIDDTIIARDTSDLIFRIRAQEVLLGRGLANYLIDELGESNIVTVQMDVASTAGVVGFTTALAEHGVRPSRSYLLDDNTTVEDLVEQISTTNPGVVVVYGPPATASILYGELRSSGWGGRFAYNQADSTEFRASVPFERLTGVISVTTWSYSSPTRASERFVLDYIGAYGEIPDPVAAAAYDGIRLLATAIGNPGTLTQNLANLDAVRGVQGELSTSELLVGELSNNVAVTELGAFGAPELIVRYSGNTMVVDTEDEEPIATQVAQATFTPAPTATPDSPYLIVTRAVQNVRSGPGLNYDIIGQLQEGDTAQVIGANIDFSWVVISFRGGQGWLSRGILDLFGNVNQIPIIAPPPTPTPPPATATPTAEPFADVVIVGVTPNRLVIGQPFTVTVTVRNQGALAAGGFAIAATFEPGSVYAAVNLPGLAPGQQANVTLTGLLTGATGPRNVVIVADLNNQVNEGIAGEANNDDYIYSYVADNSTLTPGGLGSITLAPGSTINLDGSTDDLLWTGTDLVAQNGAQIYLLSGFTSLDQIHYDVISTTTNASPINVTLLTNAFIGLRTDTGNQKRGVIRVDGAISGGNLTIAYRVYN
ncbi:MAG: ABC transporter substrate-binding protein [Anaerolineaceae bacterium]|nr:ABC transporter substrate-binding protein [Anaerolineaceae bacterium]